MSTRRPTRAKKQGRPIVLPQTFPGGQPASDALLTGNQTRQIQDLIDLLRRNNLTELELERQGVRIRVRHEVVRQDRDDLCAGVRAGIITAVDPARLLRRAVGRRDGRDDMTITSPIVGTFYRSPSPDADPYVEDGDYVKKGQVLCIVEAMNLLADMMF